MLLQRLNLCSPPLHLKLIWDREQTAPPGLLPLLQMLKDGRLGMLLLLPLLQVAGAVPQSTVLLILLLRWNLTALPILLPKGLAVGLPGQHLKVPATGLAEAVMDVAAPPRL